GDVVQLPQGGGLYRIDRSEHAEMQQAEAVRIEPGVYAPSDMADDPASAKPFAAPAPVLPVFMDLPLITGDEEPHAPLLAVGADPWPGSVAVYTSNTDEDYALAEVIASQAVIGFTETPMARATVGVWDEGEPLQVSLISGALESRPRSSLLSGANLAAIGDGTPGNWELFQFGTAELQGAGVYNLSGRLRGQLGSDAQMPDIWPVGSTFVLLDERVIQTGLLRSERGVAKHYRIGPATRSYDDEAYEHLVEAFDGNGLRPYAPVHLRVRKGVGGDDVFWVRRTRLDGDDWTGLDVPLAEETEAYLLRIRKDGALVREEVIEEPMWHYADAAKTGDGVIGAYDVEIAQVSATYGPGPFAGLTVG
ncbi:MAG: phage tail baseplate protein, partial [Ruegeria sp.]